jgi:hypothetical protein
MEIVGKVFTVHDAQGRKWGTVLLSSYRVDPQGFHHYSGQLSPAPIFSQVRPLFEQFDAVFGNTHRDRAELNRLTDEILALNVRLISEAHPAQVISGVVTVEPNLSLNCQVRHEP